MSLNDCRFDGLRTQGFTGATNDMVLQWLQANGATSDQINDAWYEFLIGQGIAPAQLNDMWFAWLEAQGYTGAINDMETEFWCVGGGVVGPGVSQIYIEDCDRGHVHVIFNGTVAGTSNLGVTYTLNGGGAQAFLGGTPLGGNHIQYTLNADAQEGDAIRWIYAEATGDLTVGGEALPDVDRAADNQVLQIVVTAAVIGTAGLNIGVVYNKVPVGNTGLTLTLDAVGNVLTYTETLDKVQYYSLATTAIVGEEALLFYTPGDITDECPYPLKDFTVFPVTNNTGAVDVPIVTGSVVNAAGTQITITFDLDITGSNGFTLTADGAPIALGYQGYSNKRSFYSTEQIYVGQTVLLSYAPGDVKAGDTGYLQPFTDAAVDNQSTAPSPVSDPILTLPQADAQGVVLMDEWTDARSTPINLRDFEGILRSIPEYMPPLEGARNTVNELPSSNLQTALETFVNCTVNNVLDKDGNNSAVEITSTGALGRATYVRGASDNIIGNEYAYRGSVKVNNYISGNIEIYIGVEGVGLTSSRWIINSIPNILDGNWHDVSINVTATTASGWYIGGIAGDSGNIVTFSAPQLENVTAQALKVPSLYTPVGTAVGAEKIVNGGFDTDLTGWSTENAIVTWEAGGFVRIDRGGNAYGNHLYQDIPTVPNKIHYVELNIISLTNDVNVEVDNTVVAILSITGVHRVSFEAISTTSKLEFNAGGAVGAICELDDISVFEESTGNAYNLRENALTVTDNIVDESVVGPLISPAPQWAQEPESENVHYQSNDLSLWTGTTVGVFVTEAAATGPFGITDLWHLYEGSATSTHYTGHKANITATNEYTTSFYGSPAEYDWVQLFGGGSAYGTDAWVNFNVATGAVGNVGPAVIDSGTVLDNGIYRCWAKFTCQTSSTTGNVFVALTNDADSVRLVTYLGDGASGVNVGHFQTEEGDLTPYIQTTTAPVVRYATLTQNPYSAAVFNDTEGMAVIRYEPQVDYTVETVKVFGVRGANNSLFSTATNGRANSTDATTTILSAGMNSIAGKVYLLGLRWNTSTPEFQVGYKKVTDGGSWVWGTAQPYDGSFNPGATLDWFRSVTTSHRFEELAIYDSDQGTQFFEDNY